MSVELIFSSVETISTIITETAKMKTISCLEIRSLTSFVYHQKSKMNVIIYINCSSWIKSLFFSVDYFVIITIWNNSRSTDALVPVLACQDRVLRVLQVMSQLGKCNACFAHCFQFNGINESLYMYTYFSRLDTSLYMQLPLSCIKLYYKQIKANFLLYCSGSFCLSTKSSKAIWHWWYLMLRGNRSALFLLSSIVHW